MRKIWKYLSIVGVAATLTLNPHPAYGETRNQKEAAYPAHNEQIELDSRNEPARKIIERLKGKRIYLPLPENSHREGTGRYSKVIIGVDSDNPRIVQRCEGFDYIGIQAGEGTATGFPGEEIEIALSEGERKMLKEGKRIRVLIMGMIEDMSSPRDAIPESYRGYLENMNKL